MFAFVAGTTHKARWRAVGVLHLAATAGGPVAAGDRLLFYCRRRSWPAIRSEYLAFTAEGPGEAAGGWLAVPLVRGDVRSASVTVPDRDWLAALAARPFDPVALGAMADRWQELGHPGRARACRAAAEWLHQALAEAVARQPA
jgi:hypothetical protein